MEAESRGRAAATNAAHEEQRPSRAYLARGVPSDLQRQQEVRVDVAACGIVCVSLVCKRGQRFG
jgi:hypothetical protein